MVCAVVSDWSIEQPDNLENLGLTRTLWTFPGTTYAQEPVPSERPHSVVFLHCVQITSPEHCKGSLALADSTFCIESWSTWSLEVRADSEKFQHKVGKAGGKNVCFPF